MLNIIYKQNALKREWRYNIENRSRNKVFRRFSLETHNQGLKCGTSVVLVVHVISLSTSISDVKYTRKIDLR